MRARAGAHTHTPHTQNPHLPSDCVLYAVYLKIQKCLLFPYFVLNCEGLVIRVYRTMQTSGFPLTWEAEQQPVSYCIPFPFVICDSGQPSVVTQYVPHDGLFCFCVFLLYIHFYNLLRVLVFKEKFTLLLSAKPSASVRRKTEH